MPPKARITKAMIVDAAFAVVRKYGVDDINVRKVANEIGCSTQPVMYHFKTVEELKAEIYDLATKFFGDYLLAGDGEDKFDLKALCSRYLQFARDEGFLFKFIFQSGRFKGDHFDKLFGSEDRLKVIDGITKSTGFDEKQSKIVSAAMFSAVHGYASLIANRNVEYSEEISNTLLDSIYMASVAYWKVNAAN